MKKILIVLSLAFSVSGCTSFYKPVPENYAGEVATVSDTYTNMARSSAHFFVLEKVDGKQIVHSGHATANNAGLGRGLVLIPSVMGRKILPIEQMFTLVGYVQHSSDFGNLTGDRLYIAGDVSFTPTAGEEYFVKGTLSPERSSVWIEDSKGQLVGTKVEKVGQ